MCFYKFYMHGVITGLAYVLLLENKMNFMSAAVTMYVVESIDDKMMNPAAIF